MRSCIYAGSFDPITVGHLDIIKKASLAFDHVHIGILINENKDCFFNVDDRKFLIEQALLDMNILNATVGNFVGLLVDYAKEKECNHVVRGIRTSEDFIYEQNLYLINKDFAPEVETTFFFSDPNMIHISSSLVRTLIKKKEYQKMAKYLTHSCFEYINAFF